MVRATVRKRPRASSRTMVGARSCWLSRSLEENVPGIGEEGPILSRLLSLTRNHNDLELLASQ